jgi:hypothetical protein
MRYQRLFITMCHSKHTNNIIPTYSKSGGCWNPMQLYAVLRYAARFSLNFRCKLPDTHCLLTCSELYIFQDFPLHFVIIILTFAQQQVMPTKTLQPGAIGAKSNRTAGASTSAPRGETQQQRQTTVCPPRCCNCCHRTFDQGRTFQNGTFNQSHKNMNQLAIGRESIHIDVDDGQLTISLTAGVLKDQSIGARDVNPPWSTN